MTKNEETRLNGHMKMINRHWRDTFKSVKDLVKGENIKRYTIEKLKRYIALYSKLVIEFEAQLDGRDDHTI
jgi:hypothetical protein